MYDAHLHLQDERFDTCRVAAIAAAVAAGVTGGCCCGCAPGDWKAVASLTEGRPPSGLPSPETGNQEPGAAFSLLPAFGVHPWYAGSLPANWLELLEEFLTQHPEAPVGEIGIDGLRDEPSREAQRQVLRAQLDLAARWNRPVVLHGARAWGELLAIVKPFAPRLPGFVAHAFGGSEDILREVLTMGGLVSFAGPVCNPAAKRVRAAAAAAPAERLLIETDAPDMVPVVQGSECRVQGAESGIPGDLNHPANLVHVARAVAELRGVPVEEIAAITTANARRVYRIAAAR